MYKLRSFGASALLSRFIHLGLAATHIASRPYCPRSSTGIRSSLVCPPWRVPQSRFRPALACNRPSRSLTVVLPVSWPVRVIACSLQLHRRFLKANEVVWLLPKLKRQTSKKFTPQAEPFKTKNSIAFPLQFLWELPPFSLIYLCLYNLVVACIASNRWYLIKSSRIWEITLVCVLPSVCLRHLYQGSSHKPTKRNTANKCIDLVTDHKITCDCNRLTYNIERHNNRISAAVNRAETKLLGCFCYSMQLISYLTFAPH